VSYKLTRKAEADLTALIEFSTERFGSATALRHLDKLERSIEALDCGEFEGPELTIASRARPIRRWPVPPHWIYYVRVAGELRILRIYHGAREPL
jgi:plasmid stabilization system protein ParE